jgi:hypothetical protein
MSYSDYTLDNKSVFYIEMPYSNDMVYGVMFDTQNVSITEGNLVHDILHHRHNALSSENHSQPATPTSYYYATPIRSHYDGIEIDPYEMARNDPYSYYDYFDYEDNIDIDEYLYDNEYDI